MSVHHTCVHARILDVRQNTGCCCVSECMVSEPLMYHLYAPSDNMCLNGVLVHHSLFLLIRKPKVYPLLVNGLPKRFLR